MFRVKRSAFTLIELIVSLGIIALILSVAVTFQNRTVEEKLSVKKFVSDLEFLRNYSAVNNRRSYAVVYKGGSRYSLNKSVPGKVPERQEFFLKGDLKFRNHTIIEFSVSGAPAHTRTISITKNKEVCYVVTCDVASSQVRLYEKK